MGFKNNIQNGMATTVVGTHNANRPHSTFGFTKFENGIRVGCLVARDATDGDKVNKVASATDVVVGVALRRLGGRINDDTFKQDAGNLEHDDSIVVLTFGEVTVKTAKGLTIKNGDKVYFDDSKDGLITNDDTKTELTDAMFIGFEADGIAKILLTKMRG